MNLLDKYNVIQIMEKKEDILEVKYPRVKLKFNDVLTSAVRHKEKTKSGLILGGSADSINTEAPLMTVQIVLAAGEHSAYKVGEVVEIDTDSFKTRANPNPHDMGNSGFKKVIPLEWADDIMCLRLGDRQIKYAYDGFEVDGEELLNHFRNTKSY